MGAGSRQDGRLPRALAPGYVLPDELGTAERLRATLEFARCVAFSEPQGTREGSWAEALERDESFALADIAAFPVERERRGLLFADDPLPAVEGLAVRLDGWHRLLGSSANPAAPPVARALEREIECSLAAPLRSLAGLVPDLLDAGRLGDLGPAWALARPPEPQAGPPRPHRDAARTAGLRLLRSIAALAPLARRALPESLRGGAHEPAMGLLLAFLELHRASQEPLNRFPSRLADYYHLGLLGMRPAAAEPERVLAVLEADAAFGQAPEIPQGTRFSAGKDAQAGGGAVEFAAPAPGVLANARVTALVTLRQDRDALIEPERTLGFPSRVRAEELPSPPPDAADAAWRPLFGGSSPLGAAPDARLGFAVASPLFDLREGERELKLTLRLGRPADRDARLRELLALPESARPDGWLAEVFGRLDACERVPCAGTPGALAAGALGRDPNRGWDPALRYRAARCLEDPPELLAEGLGALFTAWLTSPGGLAPADLAAVRLRAALVLGPRAGGVPAENDPLGLFFSPTPPQRELIFDRVFRGLWKAEVSGPSGWMDAGDVFCRPADGNAGPAGGIAILLRLGPDRPPVVPCSSAAHGRPWAALATVRLELQNHTLLFGYGLLRGLAWREIEVSVSVRGLKDLRAANHMGRLDTGKPFQPFGPLPGVGSHLILGSQEMAAKPLSRVRFRLEWGGLPRLEGGLAAHYAGYPGTWDAEGFLARADILKDGQWQAVQGPPLRLFGNRAGTRRVPAQGALEPDPADVARLFRPREPGPEPFEYSPQSRGGFFRFELAAPEQAFGQALHGRLLTEVLTRNARLKRQDPLPLEPYTPVIQWVQADYEASHVLQAREDPALEDGHRVYLLHPFSVEELKGGRRESGPLVPGLEHDGCLHLGLDFPRPPASLPLLFHLRPESAAEPDGPEREAPRWWAWCRGGWRPLAPTAVLEEGTLGFLASGVVRLELPRDMVRGCPELPGDCYWLRLGADRGLEGFAGLYGVHANGMELVRVGGPGADAPAGGASPSLPSGSLRAPLRAVPGLKRVVQVGRGFGRRPAQSRQGLLERSAERLRHKGRAVSAWDYERLLLDSYPEVRLARAFGPDEPRWAAALGLLPRPGEVLVAVVPPPSDPDDPLAAPRFDAATLEGMARRLRRAAPEGVRVAVRNAVYERIQARCTVRLARGVHPGAGLRALNASVVRYLSPWCPGGLGTAFGWELRARDLEAHLRAQDGVESVGDLSLLHCVERVPNRHALDDSARTAAADPATLVRPALPWSLPLPTPGHLIEADPQPGRTGPRPTGIGRLEIGNTLILDGDGHDA